MVLCARGFFGACDEHSISTVPSGTKLFAAAVAEGLAGGRPLGVFHFGCGGHPRRELFLRALRRGRTAEQPVRSADAAEGVGVRVCERSVQFAQDRAEAGRGCGVSGSGCGEFSRSSNDQPVSTRTCRRVCGDLCASGETGAGDEADSDGDAGDRRDEGTGEREQTQVDELWADEGARAEVKDRDRGSAAACATDR